MTPNVQPRLEEEPARVRPKEEPLVTCYVSCGGLQHLTFDKSWTPANQVTICDLRIGFWKSDEKWQPCIDCQRLAKRDGYQLPKSWGTTGG